MQTAAPDASTHAMESDVLLFSALTTLKREFCLDSAALFATPSPTALVPTASIQQTAQLDPEESTEIAAGCAREK